MLTTPRTFADPLPGLDDADVRELAQQHLTLGRLLSAVPPARAGYRDLDGGAVLTLLADLAEQGARLAAGVEADPDERISLTAEVPPC